MAEQGPFLPGDELHQVGLDSNGILCGAEPQPLGKSAHVGIDDDPNIHTEGITEDHVGRLAPDPRQFGQSRNRRWHFATVLGEDHSAGGLDVLRLVLVETDPTDCVGELLRIAVGIVCWGLVVPEQFFGHLVDLFVGALGREDGGHQEFQRI